MFHIRNYIQMCNYCFYTDHFVLSSFIDFLFVESHSCFSGTQSSWDSLESLPAMASLLSSRTSLKHGAECATELPIFQPLTVSSFLKTEQGIQKYSLHLKRVYFAFFRHKEQDYSPFPAIFSTVILCAWQLPKN